MVHPRRQKRLIEAQFNKLVNQFIWKNFEVTTKQVLADKSKMPYGTVTAGSIGGIGIPSGIAMTTVMVYKYEATQEELFQGDMDLLKQRCKDILSGDDEWVLLLTDNSAVIRDFAAYVLKRI